MNKSQPNFLVICVDQMQSFMLGCHGHRQVRTPHLDRLAASGVSFARAYCGNPVCMPSRASLLTGLTPRQHGVLTNGTRLPADVPTVTGALAAAGYRTHSVGKLHFQPFHPTQPYRADGTPQSWEHKDLWDNGEIQTLPSPYYGFQTAEYMGGHVHYNFGDYANWLRREHPGKFEEYGRYRYFEPAFLDQIWKINLDPELHYNHWIADRTMAFLDGAGAQPFFAWCSFPDPHHPFAACRPYCDMFDPREIELPATWQQRDDLCAFLAQRRAHSLDEDRLRRITAQTYGMLAHVDDNVGRILAHLQRRGLDQNTVVVFLADHGEYLGTHGLLGKSAWEYEQLWRVPFIWRAPQGHPVDHLSRQVVGLIDFVPTVLDFAGVSSDELRRRLWSPTVPALPGRSLRSVIEGTGTIANRPAIIEFDEDIHDGPMWQVRGLVNDRYKLVVYPRERTGILTDLQEDPDELVNLWNSPAHQSVKTELLAELLAELARSDRYDQPRVAPA